MIGRFLGRYRIVEALGEGGMGTVYRAHDPRLERDVALKVLRTDVPQDDASRRRLRQEARTLSRLMHPNVATLFDFDADAGLEFLVLEFVPGETLAVALRDGPLPERRARAIGGQVADALAAAHELGIVHRDLKPGNVVLTPRGNAKVLDFGLAHIFDAPSHSSASLTSAGIAPAGTVPYMAPEQIRGERLDPRTDLYALGALLFEMTTGERPYPDGEMVTLLYRILNQPPRALRDVRPGLSADLGCLVARCLEKSPERRHPSAAALGRALRQEASGDPPSGFVAAAASAAGGAARGASDGIRSLAVLPFENRSGDPEQEFFVDGMTDALIADLAQIAALRVISRTSAMRFKGARAPLADIARDLRVDAVVEGSALRAGDRVRITVQLIDAAADRNLWARSYERPLTDIITLQREVAREIAGEIRIQVAPAEQARLASKGPVDPTAHLAYLQGRYLWNRWDAPALRESIARFEEALAADPTYALAYAGLADSYGVLGNTGTMSPGEAYTRARDAADRGLELDPSLAEAHASRAYVSRFFEWDWPRAERGFLRALELNPGYASGRRWYAQFLSGMGRHDEAIAEAERALEADPLSLVIHTSVGDVLFFARRYERAAEYYARCLALDPTFGAAHTDLARALEHLGRFDEAVEHFRLSGAGPGPGYAIMLARAGRLEEAGAMMAEVMGQAGRRYVSAFGVASYHAVIGETTRALDWLERAYEERDGTMVWLGVHPRFDHLRAEPRFRDLLARMRLDA